MNPLLIVLVLLAVLVLILLFIATMAERRLKLVRTQLILEKKDIEHRAELGDDSHVVNIVDTVRSEASLRRIEFWTKAGWKSLWKGIRIK